MEQELLRKQEEDNNKTLYLMKVGMIFHTYEARAFALARVMHYRIKYKICKGGPGVLVVVFPANSLPVVAERTGTAGRKVLVQTDTWVETARLDCTADAMLVDKPKTAANTESKVEERKKCILDYDMLYATSLEAMSFLSVVQKDLKN